MHFVNHRGSHFFSLTPEYAKKCKLLVFQADFSWMTKKFKYRKLAGFTEVRTTKKSLPTLIYLVWWSVGGSNSSPLPCHGSALPNELTPRVFILPQCVIKWKYEDDFDWTESK